MRDTLRPGDLARLWTAIHAIEAGGGDDDSGYVLTSDARLSDARTPTGSAGGDLTGTYPNPVLAAVALAKLAAQAQATVVGRAAGAGSGVPSALTASQLVAIVSGVLAAGDVSGFDTQVRTSGLDQMAAPVGPVAFGGQRATGGADPVSAQDFGTKAYIDATAQGLAPKGSVAVATTAALPTNTYLAGVLAGTGTGVLTVDGTAVALNDRVMVKNETAGANNGLYRCSTAGAVGVAYVLTRATDMDTAAEFPGAFAFVEGGTVNAASGWVVAAAGPFVVGTTTVTWTQFSGAGEITAGTGLDKTGNTIFMANMVQATVKGRAAAAGTGAPGDLTAAQLVAIITGTIATTDVAGLGTIATQAASAVAVTGGTAVGLTSLGVNIASGLAAPAQIVGDQGSSLPVMFADQYSGASGTAVTAGSTVMRSARGTAGSPAALKSGDHLGGVFARGHDGTAFSTAASAAVNAKAAEDWTTSAHGGMIDFQTIAIGAVTGATSKLRINASVGINMVLPTKIGGAVGDTPACLLELAGGMFRLAPNAMGSKAAGTYTVDVTLGNVVTVSVTGNVTLNASAAGSSGMLLTVVVTSDGSARVVTFGTSFKPTGTLTPGASKQATITFVSDGSNWCELSRTIGL